MITNIKNKIFFGADFFWYSLGTMTITITAALYFYPSGLIISTASALCAISVITINCIRAYNIYKK